MAHYLAEKFGSLEKLSKASIQDLMSLPNVGYEVAKSIVEFFKNEENQKLIQRLLSAGIQFEDVKEAPKEEKPQILKGLTFVFTGTLKSMTREQAKKRVLDLGGRVSDSVSKKIDYLVVGENPGSKLKKAQNLGIKCISEEEFLNLLKQA